MPRTGLDADFAPMADAVGKVTGITGYLRTNQHLSKAARSLATAAAQDIGDIMDDQTATIGYPYAPLAHVYEYEAFRTGGFKKNRLFRFNVNTAGSGNAVVSFMFTDSHFQIATPRENVEAGLISLSEKSLDAFEDPDRGGDKRYVFREQAVSFEYGADVVVKSREGADGWLAVPQKFNPRPQFLKGSYPMNLETAQNGVHFGAFTNTWIALSKTVTEQSTTNLERGIARMMKENTRRSGRVSKKSFNIAFKSAEKEGLDFAKKRTDRMYSDVRLPANQAND